LKTDENNPSDWLRSAKIRLHSSDRLYPIEGNPGGDLDEVGHDYPALRQSLGEMAQLIETAIASGR
jgi:hypothetical protein